MKICSKGDQEKDESEFYFQKCRGYVNPECIRLAALMAYGGLVCACCGETELAFLTLDHINNNGATERLKIAGRRESAGTYTYNWLRKNGWPPGYQVLCMNCNFGKRMNNGVCPHRERCNDYPEREYSQATGSAALVA